MTFKRRTKVVFCLLIAEFVMSAPAVAALPLASGFIDLQASNDGFGSPESISISTLYHGATASSYQSEASAYVDAQNGLLISRAYTGDNGNAGSIAAASYDYYFKIDGVASGTQVLLNIKDILNLGVEYYQDQAHATGQESFLILDPTQMANTVVNDNLIYGYGGQKIQSIVGDRNVSVTAGTTYYLLALLFNTSSGGAKVEGNAKSSFTIAPTFLQTHPGANIEYSPNVFQKVVAVPEPANWLLFILGFAAIGLKTRQANRRLEVLSSLIYQSN
ncbi:hypothetical protein KZX46_02130 (plasmid) [Polymorphobacter sp. PAMC 29334]|uniref:hypothetical protein n=1 Tax=Polymorphobacter sp. PAMC 29334 TaxID=2862331 RepID=UPI001C77A458|nr:hypothetical protein [Polymorphobacter sp. PAMC 29334]QYE32971.1 hypothetical protein KZX46_02130 [Polymorphobacter sp. PAMC 29334]